MIRLSLNDSVPRVKEAAERHMRLCTQNRNGEKYKNLISPLYNDFDQKIKMLEDAQKELNYAQDSVWLYGDLLKNGLRDLKGRTSEFDRNNVGSNLSALLFPDGNISSIMNLPDKDEPVVAHNIVLKIQSLGESHELFPYAAKIEGAVGDCRDVLDQLTQANQNLASAKTALEIAKAAAVKQYNANYFVAATDYDKAYAEALFPRIRPTKKKSGDTGNGNGEPVK